MYIVISDDKRVPTQVKNNFEYEHWSIAEFVERASSENGFIIDEGVYYDVAYINEDIYNSLKEYAAYYGTNVVYYKFNDIEVSLPFQITEGIKNFVEKKPSPVPETPVATTTQQPVNQQPQVQAQPPAEQPIATPPPQSAMPAQQMPPEPPTQPTTNPLGINVVNSNGTSTPSVPRENPSAINSFRLKNLFNYTNNTRTTSPSGGKNGRAILFGSLKGGTGKTFTCLMSAYRYAEARPHEKIAVADFDIIDGQVGIVISESEPTMERYYQYYKQGMTQFEYLNLCRVQSPHFKPNVDFYLAPLLEDKARTNDATFWHEVFKHLLSNYDVVFFDSGIDFLGLAPISELYKIADKIIITCNTSVPSVRSVMKQFQHFNGELANNVFTPEDRVLDRVNVVLTRVSTNNAINKEVIDNIGEYAKVVAAFGDIDTIVEAAQWYQQWHKVTENEAVVKYLDIIAG